MSLGGPKPTLDAPARTQEDSRPGTGAGPKLVWDCFLKKAEYDHKLLVRSKWEYYTGKADASVYKETPFDIKVLKSDVHIYIDSDEELQKADQKVAYLNVVVKYLEQVLRSINNRTFLIKNAIEWKKFTSGAI